MVVQIPLLCISGGLTIYHNERGDCVSPPGIRLIRNKGNKIIFVKKTMKAQEFSFLPDFSFPTLWSSPFFPTVYLKSGEGSHGCGWRNSDPKNPK